MFCILDTIIHGNGIITVYGKNEYNWLINMIFFSYIKTSHWFPLLRPILSKESITSTDYEKVRYRVNIIAEWTSVKLLFPILLSISNRIPTRGSSNKGSHVYFLLIHGTTVVMSDCTIVTSGHHGSTRTTFILKNSTIWQHYSNTPKTCTRKYTWLPFLLLPPSGYSCWDTENYIKI